MLEIKQRKMLELHITEFKCKNDLGLSLVLQLCFRTVFLCVRLTLSKIFYVANQSISCTAGYIYILRAFNF